MDRKLTFSKREDFRQWLVENCETSEGVWLLFGKKGGLQTLKAAEALEEALCYGWIDGKMQKINETTYKKYFSQRRRNSKWSEKNKKLVQRLEERALMTEFGRQKISEAKENGQWDLEQPTAITADQIVELTETLVKYEPAYTNFCKMSPSVKKTYARAYFDAKTTKGKQSRLTWMVNRLNKNLKPM